MTGRWILVTQPDHACDPPGIRGQGAGSIWECHCGQRFRVELQVDRNWAYLSRLGNTAETENTSQGEQE